MTTADTTQGDPHVWTFQHTETTTASPAHLWRRYSDPTTWPVWDHDTARVELDGPFALGTTGTLHPVRGPRAAFTFTEVTPGVSFTDTTRLPLATMAFTHVVEPLAPGAGPGCRFTHGVTIRGPLAALFGRVVGSTVAAGLPRAMQKLARLAEADQASLTS